MVKECIRQIVNRVKGSFPDHFVKVTVDTRDMTFKVARKPPKGDPDPGWKYRIGDIPIPNICFDLNIRRVPRDFILPIPVKEKEDEPTPYRNTRRPEKTSEGSKTSGDEALIQPTPQKTPQKTPLTVMTIREVRRELVHQRKVQWKLVKVKGEGGAPLGNE
jgi:hypothetical protein